MEKKNKETSSAKSPDCGCARVQYERRRHVVVAYLRTALHHDIIKPQPIPPIYNPPNLNLLPSLSHTYTHTHTHTFTYA